MYVPPSMAETKFYTHTEALAQTFSVYGVITEDIALSNFTVVLAEIYLGVLFTQTCFHVNVIASCSAPIFLQNLIH
jgi:hypothetical protein